MNGDDVVAVARKQIGKPYVFGAVGPNSFDCSGLVMYAYAQCGYKWSFRPVVHTLVPMGTDVAKADLMPGDLVMPSPAHVQIYSGDGKIIEAAHTGTNIREINLWGFWKARRLIAPGTGKNDGPGTLRKIYNWDPIGDTLGNPIDGTPGSVQELTNTFQTYAKAAGWLTDPHNWQRMGMFSVGAFLCIVALIGIAKVQSAGDKVVNAVGGPATKPTVKPPKAPTDKNIEDISKLMASKMSKATKAANNAK
jgi:NlpC/P60 family protein